MLIIRKSQVADPRSRAVKLTKGKVAIVDSDLFDYLNQFYWRACKVGRRFYATRRIWINGKPHDIKMHREITQCPGWIKIHHIDHNTLNNRRDNLQQVTEREHRHFDGWHYFER